MPQLTCNMSWRNDRRLERLLRYGQKVVRKYLMFFLIHDNGHYCFKRGQAGLIRSITAGVPSNNNVIVVYRDKWQASLAQCLCVRFVCDLHSAIRSCFWLSGIECLVQCTCDYRVSTLLAVQSSAAQCSSLLLQSLSSDNSQLSQWMSVIISKDSTNFAKSAPWTKS